MNVGAMNSNNNNNNNNNGPLPRQQRSDLLTMVINHLYRALDHNLVVISDMSITLNNQLNFFLHRNASRIRKVAKRLEVMQLCIAMFMFIFLLCLHTTFVSYHKNQVNCLQEYLPLQDKTNYEIVRFEVHGMFYDYFVPPPPRLNNSSGSDGIAETQQQIASPSPPTDSISTTSTSTSVDDGQNNKHNNKTISKILEALLDIKKTYVPYKYSFIYAREKGFLYLSNDTKTKHNISTETIQVHWNDTKCFTRSKLANMMIELFVGYDTIVINTFLQFFERKGVIHSEFFGETFNLGFMDDIHQSSKTWEGKLLHKAQIVVTTLFVFLMLYFLVFYLFRVINMTVRMQLRRRRRTHIAQFLAQQTAEFFVFIPMLSGTVLFIGKFFDDEIIAFVIVCAFWLMLLFTLIGARSPISKRYFPPLFNLSIILFLLYAFSFPFGFTYMCFTVCLSFVAYATLYFWNRFEANYQHNHQPQQQQQQQQQQFLFPQQQPQPQPQQQVQTHVVIQPGSQPITIIAPGIMQPVVNNGAGAGGDAPIIPSPPPQPPGGGGGGGAGQPQQPQGAVLLNQQQLIQNRVPHFVARTNAGSRIVIRVGPNAAQHLNISFGPAGAGAPASVPAVSAAPQQQQQQQLDRAGAGQEQGQIVSEIAMAIPPPPPPAATTAVTAAAAATTAATTTTATITNPTTPSPSSSSLPREGENDDDDNNNNTNNDNASRESSSLRTTSSNVNPGSSIVYRSSRMQQQSDLD